MTKVISWHDIINFIFKLKIKLFIWIYTDIMKLYFYLFLNYKWIQNTITFDLGFHVRKRMFSFFLWADIIGKSLTNIVWIIEPPNIYQNKCFHKISLNIQTREIDSRNYVIKFVMSSIIYQFL